MFIALVFDKMSVAGVEELGRFCDPGFCVAWRGDGGKRYFEPMGVWASKHKGESVYKNAVRLSEASDGILLNAVDVSEASDCILSDAVKPSES